MFQYVLPGFRASRHVQLDKPCAHPYIGGVYEHHHKKLRGYAMRTLILPVMLAAALLAVPAPALSQASLSGVQFCGTSMAMAVGQSGTLLRSNDGGVTWSSVHSGVTTYLLALSFPSSNVGTAVGGDPINGTQTVLHTVNGGSSWVAQSTGTTQPLLGVAFADANNGFAVGYSGVILHTTDGGSSWQNQVTGVLTVLNAISYIDANTATIVGDLGVIMRTTNGGASWSQQSSGTGSDLYGVHFSSSSTGTAVGTSGTILRTVNGGSSWTKQTSGTTNFLNSVYFRDANNGWAVGNNGAILHTGNGGSSWTDQSVFVANFSDVSFKDANTGLVVGDHGTTILRTVNGGASWTRESSISAVENSAEIPLKMSLDQNYPNPFNPSTTIGFSLEKRTMVRLIVFNSLGQEVATLLNGESGPGYTSVNWLAQDGNGRSLPSGIYFYELRAGSPASAAEASLGKRMVLLK
jgi:photosystem II stability/assembly factor-like uncharacterized protein